MAVNDACNLTNPGPASWRDFLKICEEVWVMGSTTLHDLIGIEHCKQGFLPGVAAKGRAAEDVQCRIG